MIVRKKEVPFSLTPFKGDTIPDLTPRAPIHKIISLHYEGEMERLAEKVICFHMHAKGSFLVEDSVTGAFFPYEEEISEASYVFDEEDSELEEELIKEEDSVCYIFPEKECDVGALAYLALRTELPSRLVEKEEK